MTTLLFNNLIIGDFNYDDSQKGRWFDLLDHEGERVR